MSVWAYGFENEGNRYDATPTCKPGNKPCGARCIPQKWSCGGVRAARLAAGAGTLALTYAAVRGLKQGFKPNNSSAMVRKSGPGAAAPRSPRAAAPYRSGKSVDYWSPNAETNDLRRAEAGLGWAANDINNTERRSQGLMSLNPGYRTTPGRSNRRPRPMKRKS